MSQMAPDPNLLQQLLAGAGGAPPDAGAAPPDAGPEDQGGGDTIGILQQMLDLGKQYLEVEQDEEDKLTMTKVISQLQGYLANEQKEQDGLVQGKMGPKTIRRMSGGGPQY